MSKQIVLPADVYDTLELVAQEFGGVGAGKFFDDKERQKPCCIRGLADFAESPEASTSLLVAVDLQAPINRALTEAFTVAGYETVSVANDEVVGESSERISFAEWCKRLNVVRGE